MRRLPLADELPYHFYPPKIQPLWSSLAKPYIRRVLKKELKIVEIDFGDLSRLKEQIGKGDGILLAPNHCDHADCGLMFELARRLGMPFYYMAAYQIFAGLNRFPLPRLGVFPVDREGSDIRAFKTAVGILSKATNPLVVFPEGEIYHMADRLTPLREGAGALAASAAKTLAKTGKTVWIWPIGIKYRYIDADPIPVLLTLMESLEARFTWFPRRGRSLVVRIYDYAEALLALKEIEYLGNARKGPLRERIADLRTVLLESIEDRRLGKRSAEDVPTRVKELRRVCIERLADRTTDADEAFSLRKDLHDLFVVIQLFSYPGDYLKACPTVERAAEILLKFEQDVLGANDAEPRGRRRAILRLGEPIDVGARLTPARKLRSVIADVTVDLERSIQALLDQIGVGRPLTSLPSALCPSESADLVSTPVGSVT